MGKYSQESFPPAWCERVNLITPNHALLRTQLSLQMLKYLIEKSFLRDVFSIISALRCPKSDRCICPPFTPLRRRPTKIIFS